MLSSREIWLQNYEQRKENERIEFENWQNEQDDEYHNRKLWFITNLKGKVSVPPGINFHPNRFYGTRCEYDKIINELFKDDSVGKYISCATFETEEEFNKMWPDFRKGLDY